MFRHMLIPVFLLAAGPALAEAVTEPLTADRDQASQSGCTHDESLCLNMTVMAGGQPSALKLSFRGNAPAVQSYDLSGIAPDAFQQVSIWPEVIRFGGGVLAGVQTETSAAYSGGGAQATQLHLVAFLPGQKPWSPLAVTVRASAIIRACFSEQDVVNRAGACHDEYDFTGDLSAETGMQDGMPVLHYTTVATSYPGNVSRSEDSLARPPLTKSGLITVKDPLCSYERVFTFDPGQAQYSADMPLPDCADWTVP